MKVMLENHKWLQTITASISDCSQSSQWPNCSQTQALELEIKILQEQNKQLTESTVSLKESLNTTVRHLKEQSDFVKKLSPTQDRLLESIANINISGK